MFRPWPRLVGPTAFVARDRTALNHVLVHDPDELHTGRDAQVLADQDMVTKPFPLPASPIDGGFVLLIFREARYFFVEAFETFFPAILSGMAAQLSWLCAGESEGLIQ